MSIPRPARSPRPLLPLLLLAAPWTAACETDGNCSLLGCTDQLTVVVVPPPTGFVAGTYLVEVQTSAGTQQCGLTIERGCANIADCVVDDEWRLLTTSDAGGPELRYYTSGSPETVTITVTRNGVPLTQVTRSPGYALVAPTGPECDPVCDQAEEVVALP